MIEPMTSERLDEIRAFAARWPEEALKDCTPTSPFRQRADLLAEVDRLTGAYERLAACVGALDFDRSESGMPETQEQWIEFVRALDDRAQALIEKDCPR